MNITIARGTSQDCITDIAWCDAFGNVGDHTPYHEVGNNLDQAFEYVKLSALNWTHVPLKLNDAGQPILELIVNGPDFEVVATEAMHDHQVKRLSHNTYFCENCDQTGNIHELAALECEEL